MNSKIIKIFNKIMKTKIKKISSSMKINSNNWDSINHLKLIFELEKKFKITFGAEEIEKNVNLKKISDNIKNKILKNTN